MTPEQRYLNENDEGSLNEMLVAIDNFHATIYQSNKNMRFIIEDHEKWMNRLLVVVTCLGFINVVVIWILMLKGIL